MADNVTVDNGDGTDYTVSSDEGAGGHVQRVKLAYSADGSETHITADANGLLVNLGTNNDVTVTGTVTVDGSGVTQPVSDGGGTLSVDDGAGSLTVDNAGLTELAAAINASSQLDVNLAASAATVTVSGTVDLGATDNAVLDNIDADLTTVIGHVDGIEGLLTTIDADTGGILTSVQTLDNAISGNEMQVDVVAALPAGTNSIGAVTPRPETSGGLSIFRSIDLDETEEEVKASAGQVYGWFIANTATSTRFVKFYNATAANVTVGTTTPVLTLPIPGNSSDDVAAHLLGAHGITFDTAITVAATTGVADNDTGAPGANEVIINVFYK